jgi:hypothetical protein
MGNLRTRALARSSALRYRILQLYRQAPINTLLANMRLLTATPMQGNFLVRKA